MHSPSGSGAQDGFLEAKHVQDYPGLYLSNFGGLLAAVPGGPRVYAESVRLHSRLAT